MGRNGSENGRRPALLHRVPKVAAAKRPPDLAAPIKRSRLRAVSEGESTERPLSRNLLSQSCYIVVSAVEFESPPVRACRPCEASGDFGRGWAAKCQAASESGAGAMT